MQPAQVDVGAGRGPCEYGREEVVLGGSARSRAEPVSWFSSGMNRSSLTWLAGSSRSTWRCWAELSRASETRGHERCRRRPESRGRRTSATSRRRRVQPARSGCARPECAGPLTRPAADRGAPAAAARSSAMGPPLRRSASVMTASSRLLSSRALVWAAAKMSSSPARPEPRGVVAASAIIGADAGRRSPR